ncbi:MAG: pyruvate, phosphate dikinase [Deltaproteobacteria bacterium]|nr:pyruvate, phosphate dikinase [Deltaproteobacteria bacterium]
MQSYESMFTTGLPGLDSALKGVLAGDNIVWQVDSIEDYQALTTPFVQAGIASGRKVIYFRFASHPPLLQLDKAVTLVELDPNAGFETFIALIHQTIEQAGRGALYVFDCLSELAADWYSDQMLGNFFVLTCPYLFDLETVAYFALFRNYHSSRALQPIFETTQLFLDVYRFQDKRYIYPLKVHLRYSPTMNMLHEWKGDEFLPVTASAIISSILTSVNWSGLDTNARPGFWERTFSEGEEMQAAVDAGRCPAEKEDEMFQRLCRMMMSRDPGILKLVSRYMKLKDVLEIRRRMIGSGLVGGKTLGMLLARRILQKHSSRFTMLLEAHDSFYIGSDIFFTFLVRNGVWWVREKQRNPQTFLEGSELARQRILTGQFPDYLIKQFEQMLNYFGQAPIIVRSSSLLEDNFGNSFAGKYESVFCPNQGPRERRLEDFLSAVRTIYASSMSERALRYRDQKGLLEQDEQMALLVMRVSGSVHGRYFYPHAAGVGFSYNPYVWNENIDPKAGVMRLVFGLGTRAVDRSDDDYTRVVALNAPDRRPEINFEEVRQYAQRRVDYLDLDANRLVSGHFLDVIAASHDVPVRLFASTDNGANWGLENATRPTWVLTFDKLLSTTAFVEDIREMLRALHQAYDYPVDVEFTLNFLDNQDYRIHIVQCRPLPVKGMDTTSPVPMDAPEERRIVSASGAVIGHSRHVRIDRIIYVTPGLYGKLTIQERHEVARLISQLNQTISPHGAENTLLIGPGRWGTSCASLGIPVSFSDINRIAVVCEIVTMHENLVPDVSLGTHFLNELIEMDMLYLALFPQKGDNSLSQDFFNNMPNRLLDYVPKEERWADVVKVILTADVGGAVDGIFLSADSLKQKVICYMAS